MELLAFASRQFAPEIVDLSVRFIRVLTFISWSPFSVSSQTVDRTWLNKNTVFIKLTPPSVLHTACCAFVSQRDSSACQTLHLAVYDSPEMYGQVSLFGCS